MYVGLVAFVLLIVFYFTEGFILKRKIKTVKQEIKQLDKEIKQLDKEIKQLDKKWEYLNRH
jgi:Tfp pilus assembly protein PilN